MAWRLGEQGINLVLVAMPEPMLDATDEELRSAFPKIEIRTVLSQSE